jgi:hypothetical protein
MGSWDALQRKTSNLILCACQGCNNRKERSRRHRAVSLQPSATGIAMPREHALVNQWQRYSTGERACIPMSGPVTNYRRITESWLDEFRVFLLRHAALLRALPAWKSQALVDKLSTMAKANAVTLDVVSSRPGTLEDGARSAVDHSGESGLPTARDLVKHAGPRR